ncbi:unnamed protein product [Aphanomyces euteiches]
MTLKRPIEGTNCAMLSPQATGMPSYDFGSISPKHFPMNEDSEMQRTKRLRPANVHGFSVSEIKDVAAMTKWIHQHFQ